MLSIKIGRLEGAHDVRFGSKADMCAAKRNVCFTPNSDRESGHWASRMSPYYFFIIVAVIRHKTTAAAGRASLLVVRAFFNDAVAVAVRTGLHVRPSTASKTQAVLPQLMAACCRAGGRERGGLLGVERRDHRISIAGSRIDRDQCVFGGKGLY